MAKLNVFRGHAKKALRLLTVGDGGGGSVEDGGMSSVGSGVGAIVLTMLRLAIITIRIGLTLLLEPDRLERGGGDTGSTQRRQTRAG